MAKRRGTNETTQHLVRMRNISEELYFKVYIKKKQNKKNAPASKIISSWSVCQSFQELQEGL